LQNPAFPERANILENDLSPFDYSYYPQQYPRMKP
jgi:hypothetical protein